MLVVSRDNHGAQQLVADLATLAGSHAELPMIAFPDWETLPYDQFSPHPEIVSQRLAALHRLPALKRGIVVVPVQTLLQRLAPVAHIAGSSFNLSVGQQLDMDAEKRRLEAAGYRHVPQVTEPGEFADLELQRVVHTLTNIHPLVTIESSINLFYIFSAYIK